MRRLAVVLVLPLLLSCSIEEKANDKINEVVLGERKSYTPGPWPTSTTPHTPPPDLRKRAAGHWAGTYTCNGRSGEIDLVITLDGTYKLRAALSFPDGSSPAGTLTGSIDTLGLFLDQPDPRAFALDSDNIHLKEDSIKGRTQLDEKICGAFSVDRR